MEDIVAAKNELYRALRLYREVVGASIRTMHGDRYIVILLSHFTDTIKAQIPKTFKGNKVTHEVTGRIKAI